MAALKAKTHIALGQTFLVTTLLLAAAVLGIMPDRLEAQRQGRTALAEALAVNGSALVTQANVRRLEATLRVVVERIADLLSAAVRRAGGRADTRQIEHGDPVQQPTRIGHLGRRFSLRSKL